jgi:hypothetical protein
MRKSASDNRNAMTAVFSVGCNQPLGGGATMQNSADQPNHPGAQTFIIGAWAGRVAAAGAARPSRIVKSKVVTP